MAGAEDTSPGLRKRGGIKEKDLDTTELKTLVCLEFASKVTEDTVDWLKSKIDAPKTKDGAGLVAKKWKRNGDGPWVLLISGTTERLLLSAELMEIKKPCKDGSLREISVKHLDLFQDSEDLDHFLTMSEKQRIILQELESIRTLDEDISIPGIKSVTFYRGEAIVAGLLMKKVIYQLYPLHDKKELKYLAKEWYQAVVKKQPIEHVRRYFGETVAMYFSFLGYYTLALLPPATIGLVSKLLTESDLDLLIFFSFFNLIWATIFLESWKRNCATLAYQWGTINMEPFSKARAAYYGELGVNPVTGILEPQYPNWKRLVKLYTVSLPVVIVCLCLAVKVMLIFFYWDAITAEYSSKHPSTMATLLTLVPGIGYAIVVTIMNAAYNWLARALTDWENHRLESCHENHLVMKLVVFNFVNCFMSLFHIAFIQKNMEMLRRSLATLLIVQQLIQQCQETLIPYLIYKYYKRKITKSHEKQNSDQSDSDDEWSEMNNDLIFAEIESKKRAYVSTLDDYLELYLQFGYVFLFSAVYPTAAFWALCNNVMEIRSDAFKLCRILQRPFSRPTSGIGVWQVVFEAMGALAVMTNCALVAHSPQMKSLMPDHKEVDILMWFVMAEHAILLLKYLIEMAIPDEPEWVKIAIEKVEYEANQILNMQRLIDIQKTLGLQHPKEAKKREEES